MCGIAGLIHIGEGWEKNIKIMINEMKNRGPDDNGIWTSNSHDIVLGHTRLSINDLLPSGHQPMVSANKRYVIVLNGEIYNFKKLKKELIEIQFRGTSDTEVLLEMVNKYGIYRTLHKCKGMFAFAIYDKENNMLYLSRDRMGEKPLYYGWVSGGFCFASSINAISKIMDFNNGINKDILQFYLANKYIPAPYTIYENIYKLNPGTVMEFNIANGDYYMNNYWDLCHVAKNCRENTFKGTYEEAKSELKALLNKAVKDQMEADVPVGAFLSGGVDSSLICALMQNQSSKKIKTFTIGFSDEEYSEAKYAKEIGRYLNTDYSQLIISQGDLMNVIPKLPKILGEPFGDTSQLSTYLVSKLARENVTVSLSGDGGDELFCGYDSYDILTRRWNLIKKVPFKIKKELNYHSNKFYKSETYRNIRKITTYLSADSIGEYAQLLGQRDILINSFVRNNERLETNVDRYMMEYQAGDVTDLMISDMIRYLPDDILTKVDCTSMSNSLETRIPLLDKDVVEFALSLPIQYKYYRGMRKRILKDILFDYVPEGMIERPKRGFNVPVEKWIIEGELRDWAEDLLKYGRVNCKELLDFDVIDYAWIRFVHRGQWIDSLWNLLIFLNWHKQNYEDNS